MAKRRKGLSCFVAAPAELDIEQLRAVLRERHFSVLEWDQLFAPGRNLFESLERTISRVDLVIAVIGTDVPDSNVFVAVGFAKAIGKRLLIVAPNGTSNIPALLRDSFVLTVDLQNTTAMGFAIDQLMAAGMVQARRKTHSKSRPVLGERADELLAELADWSSGSVNRESALEELVGRALGVLELSAVSSSSIRDREGPDFAVWDDDLASLGNLVLIEVKADVRGQILQRAQTQLKSQLERANARFGLLLWGIGPHPTITRTFQRGLQHQVFSWSAEGFLASLRTRTFAEVVLAMATSGDPTEAR